ncbi:Lpg1974 family pore-forming outer membrane protein [Legionella quateirensis]|nr:Lpg1974 family pore-forming outer membrane protein [Legionella quateirensis]
MLHYVRKASFVSLIMVSSSLSFAGVMGEVQDDSKRFFGYVAPIYGSLSDEGINRTPYAEAITGGAITEHMMNPDSRWGYSLGLGYQFGPEKGHDVVLSYTNLKNRGTDAAVITSPSDVLVNRLSQIVQSQFDDPDFMASSGGQDMVGPASAVVSSHYDYQTADLITHRNFLSGFLNYVHFSRYYGIKASEFKKGFSAQYAGNFVSIDPRFFNTTIQPLTNQIDYEAKFFGIGPRIGMGAAWDLNRFFSLVGDVSASLLGGSYKTTWNEALITTTDAFIPNLPRTGRFSFTQNSNNRLWSSLVIGSNLAIATHFDLKNGSSVGVQGGINTEQYWTATTPDSIRSSNTANSVYFSQRIAVRDVFIKLSYLA